MPLSLSFMLLRALSAEGTGGRVTGIFQMGRRQLPVQPLCHSLTNLKPCCRGRGETRPGRHPAPPGDASGGHHGTHQPTLARQDASGSRAARGHTGMAGCSRLVPNPGIPGQPFQSCLALAFQFSIVVLELFSSSSPSRMKKPPAGLGGLSALSGWVLTVYLHKYLSPVICRLPL